MQGGVVTMARAYSFDAVPNDHLAPRTRWPEYVELHLFIALGLDVGQQRAATDQIDDDAEALLLLYGRVQFAEAVCVAHVQVLHKC